jgi:hypothetical protein
MHDKRRKKGMGHRRKNKKQPLNSRHDKRRKKGMGQRRKNVRSRRRPLLEMKISMKKRMIEWLSRSE